MAKYKNAGEIKVGVVGYGGAFNMGRAHLTEMAKAGMKPTVVVDIDASRLTVAEKDFPGIETYTDLGTMLRKSDVDLLAIITPHNTHAKLALQALKAGRHVVSEKPLAITTGECDAMIAAARKSGVVLSTYHNRHWDGPILQAAKDVGGGMVGDIVRMEAHMANYGKPGDWWRTSKTVSGGILYDWGVHLLEYSLQMMNDDIVEVSGFAHRGFWGPQTKWKADAIEDEGFAVVRFKKGGVLTLQISSIESNPKHGIVEITGTKGTYVMDWNHNEFISHKGGNIFSTKFKNPDGEGWKFYQNVADHLVKGAKLIITGEWARRPIQILDLACQSAVKGCAIKAKYA